MFILLTNYNGSFLHRESVQTDIPKIKLPTDFDPTAVLDHFEALHSFASETTECLPPSTQKEKVQLVLLGECYLIVQFYI